LTFDSARVPEAGRLDFMREEFGRKILRTELDISPDQPFRLRLGASDLGGVLVSWIASTPLGNTRDRIMLADGDDRFSVIMPLKGSYIGGHGTNMTPVRRGEMMALQCDRAGSVRTLDGGAFLTMLLPRPMMAATTGPKGPRLGETLPVGKAGLDLLMAYLRYASHSASASAGAREMIGRQIAELLALVATGTQASEAASRMQSVRAARLAAIHADIAAHFTELDLDVSATAMRLGISVRYAHSLLEEAGTTFGTEVRRQRLASAMTLLQDPAQAHLRITDIAFDCGFADVSYFNRLFRAHFGDSPSGARRCRVE
jgi:AraC-like DNA-binding protein